VTEEKKKSLIREYTEALVIALIMALFIRAFVVQAFKIPSGSMIPTLLIGDHLLVNKFIYGIRNPFNGSTWISIKKPERKDIIVFRYPENPDQDFIKRVIGIAGDRVEIINKKVLVNNKELKVENAIFKDPEIHASSVDSRDNLGPLIVPENSLFVMGDNRDNSHDSRFWRFVDLKAVKGEAFILYWSWNSEEFNARWSRIGQLLY
jgi:signal peptidase I